MSPSALSPATVLAGGFVAPFRLGLSFWSRAAIPLALTLLVAFAAHFAADRGWSVAPRTAVWLLMLVPMSQVLVLFHRAVLGLPEAPADNRWWGAAETRYVVALVLLLVVAFVTAYAIMSFVLPVLVFSLRSLVGTDAWALLLLRLASSAIGVVLWVWLLTPLSLCLPAIAAGDSSDPRHAWGRSRGQRWRLATVAVAVPLASWLIPDSLFDTLPAWLGWPALGLASLYLMLAWGAGLTLAYHELSGLRRPLRPPALQGFATRAAVRWAVPAGFALVVLGLGSLWAFGVMPGQYDSGHEVPESVSNPWLIRGEENLYTVGKTSVRITFDVTWKVNDEPVFQRAFNSEPYAASSRIRDQVSARLRRNVNRLESRSLQFAQELSGTVLPLASLNERLAPLGVVVTAARVVRIAAEAP